MSYDALLQRVMAFFLEKQTLTDQHKDNNHKTRFPTERRENTPGPRVHPCGSTGHWSTLPKH